MLKGKRGQIGGIPNIVTVIIIALAILGSGFLLLQEILDLDNLQELSGSSTDNNVGINSTGYTLSQSTAIAFNSPSITSVVNATDGVTITLANVTVSEQGIVTNATSTTWGNVNITYSYLYGNDPYLGVNSTITALLSIPDLLGLIILVIMVGIIIAVLLGVFPGSKVGIGA